MKKQKINRAASARLIEYATGSTLRTEYKRAAAFQQPEPRTVKQRRHHQLYTLKVVEYRPHFLTRQDNRQVQLALRADNPLHLLDIPAAFAFSCPEIWRFA